MKKAKPSLQLTGMDGNVFEIIGTASKAAARFNRDVPVEDRIDFDVIQKEAMSGNYDHILQTLMKHFDVS